MDLSVILFRYRFVSILEFRAIFIKNRRHQLVLDWWHITRLPINTILHNLKLDIMRFVRCFFALIYKLLSIWCTFSKRAQTHKVISHSSKLLWFQFFLSLCFIFLVLCCWFRMHKNAPIRFWFEFRTNIHTAHRHYSINFGKNKKFVFFIFKFFCTSFILTLLEKNSFVFSIQKVIKGKRCEW